MAGTPFDALTALKSQRLFIRAYTLVIGFPDDPTQAPIKQSFEEQLKAEFAPTDGRDLSALDCSFIVDKSVKPTEPNTCQIKVYNLGPDTRQKLSGARSLTVRLEAGYAGATSQVYFGGARAAWSTREGPDFITHIESTDTIARPTAVKKVKKPPAGSATGSIYRTMGARIPLDTALKTIAEALGVGEGNLTTALAGIPTTAPKQLNGGGMIGNARQRMTDICRSAGLEWSIQDGQLQLVNVGHVLSTTKAILVSANTGMEGSPSVDSQGAVTVKTRLIPGLAPGVLVSIDSLFVQGGYRVEKCRYVGETRGTDWSCEFDATLYTSTVNTTTPAQRLFAASQV